MMLFPGVERGLVERGGLPSSNPFRLAFPQRRRRVELRPFPSNLLDFLGRLCVLLPRFSRLLAA